MTAHNKTLRVSLLASMIIAGLGVSGGASAAPPLKVTPTVGQPAAKLPTTRLIVGYHDQRLAPSVKLATVNAAARRARAGTRSAPAAAATANMVRKLAIGADLVRLSRTMDKTELESLVTEISADPSVKFVQVDRLLQHTAPEVQPYLVPDDGYYGQYQWHLKATPGGINAEPAWDIAQGNGVVVAVIDTGIVPHPDMDASMLPGYDFIIDPFVSRRPTAGRVAGAYDYGDWTTANECGNGAPARNSSFHGTHVAGTVAEQTNNGEGMAGAAFNAKVLPIRALGRCGGYTSDIADAIIWASGGSVAGVPDNANPAEVINMSLGGGGSCDPASQAAINIAVSRGTTVVVAAGNANGDAANFSPASCDNVISVAAVGITGARASYSNYGALIDLGAPGGGGGADAFPTGAVWQAINTSPTSPDLGSPSYGGMAGTSMAAPHVAGVAALVQSAVDTPLTPAEMELLLKSSVRSFPATPDRVIGTGLLDAKLALDAALAPPGEIPVTELTSKVAVTGVSGPADGSKMYSIEVPAGARLLNLMTYGGTGNISLYVSRDVKPTTSAYGYRSARPGNNEAVRVSKPAAGTYYLLIVGETNFGGVSVQARVD